MVIIREIITTMAEISGAILTALGEAPIEENIAAFVRRAHAHFSASVGCPSLGNIRSFVKTFTNGGLVKALLHNVQGNNGTQFIEAILLNISSAVILSTEV